MWEQFDPVKAIKDAQKKLGALSEHNKEYYRFLKIDRIKTVKDMLKKPDFSLDDFNDAGMIFVLHLMTIELQASINTLDLFVLGMDEEESKPIKQKVADIKEAFIEAKERIQRYEELRAKIKRKISYQKFNGTQGMPGQDENNDLLNIITDLIDELPINEEIVVPERMKEKYIPFDMAALEKNILKNMGSTVKQIGSGIKTAETKSLGIAVTFQACLQLECEGKVCLEQLPGDVSVRHN